MILHQTGDIITGSRIAILIGKQANLLPKENNDIL